MDMDMDMGMMPWIPKPFAWHSSRNASGYNWDAITPEQTKLMFSKWLFWYKDDLYYCLPVVGLFCAAVGVAALFNLSYKLRKQGKRRSGSQSSIADRFFATARYLVSRQPRYRIGSLGTVYCPPIAAGIAVAGLFVFVMALSLGPQPYFWPNPEMGYSQPYATRTGWIALAMIPFIIAFATKVNWVTLMTGTSHEKLQVFHRWSGVIMFIPSLLHSFQFIKQEYDAGTIGMSFKTLPMFWSGITALVPLAWMVFTSWGFFRNKSYEIFKKLHFAAAALFMVSMFIHVGFVLTSVDYIFAALGLYASAYIYRVLRTIYNSGLSLKAHISVIPSGSSAKLVQIRIPVPSRVNWSPGQHVFLRFWGLGVPHAFSSHPWTITSLPADGSDAEGERSVDIVLRVHGGITRELARRAEDKAQTSVAVWVDGPYGGLPGGLDDYDSVLLLAGGSGSTFIMPLLMDLAQRRPKTVRSVQLIVAVRHPDDYTWMESLVASARKQAPELLSVQIHITDESVAGRSATTPSSDEDDDIKGEGKELSQPPLFSQGRPNLPACIREVVSSSPGRIAIAACGPDSFLYDVRNEVAERQLDIVKGTSAVTDIFLHTENYSW